eukprot:TRINITY_DN6332_c0_g1_i1.p1 TRINITY_DN6332_c0_g1~~TRINITY_DN6332_c0_g1_i1.p1  ORF type:complete len:210 (-),score=41.35 TRINITY_DN6332_c0_g1_i1:280-909(-)
MNAAKPEVKEKEVSKKRSRSKIVGIDSLQTFLPMEQQKTYNTRVLMGNHRLQSYWQGTSLKAVLPKTRSRKRRSDVRGSSSQGPSSSTSGSRRGRPKSDDELMHMCINVDPNKGMAFLREERMSNPKLKREIDKMVDDDEDEFDVIETESEKRINDKHFAWKTLRLLAFEDFKKFQRCKGQMTNVFVTLRWKEADVESGEKGCYRFGSY